MDTRTGRVKRLAGHEASIDYIAYSPDGRLVASGAEDRTALVWDTRTGALLERFQTNSTETYGVQFSPDGSTLYTAGTDRQLQVWDVAGGQRFIPRLRVVAGVDLGDGWVLPSPAGDRVAYAGTTRAADAPTSGSCPRPEGTSRADRHRPRGVRRVGLVPGRTQVRHHGRGRRGQGVGRQRPAGAPANGRRGAPLRAPVLRRWPQDRGVRAGGEGPVAGCDHADPIGRPMDIGGSILTFALAGRDGSRVLAVTYTPQPPKPNETYPTAQRWVLADAATGKVRRGRTVSENAAPLTSRPPAPGSPSEAPPARSGCWTRQPATGSGHPIPGTTQPSLRRLQPDLEVLRHRCAGRQRQPVDRT